MEDNGSPLGVVYQVNRVLKFAGGGAVSLPIKQFTDQDEAVRFKDEAHAEYCRRNMESDGKTLTAAGRVLAENGVIGWEHGLSRLQAANSRIVVPAPRLVIPR